MSILSELRTLKRKEKYFVYISFFFILFNAFPLFSDLSHIPNQVACVFVVVALFFLYPNALSSKSVKWLVVYLSIAFFLSFFKYIHITSLSSTLPAWYRLLIDAAWIFPSLYIANVLVYIHKPCIYKIIGYGSVALLTVSFVYILPMIMAYSNVLREDLMDELVVRPAGLPDYALMHSYAFMMLPMLLAIKQFKGQNRIIAAILASIFAYVITRTSVTTSLFAMIASAVLVVSYNSTKKQRFYAMLIFFATLFAFLYYSGLLLSIVDGLMPFFDGTVVLYKLQDFHDSLVLGHVTGDSLTVRVDHHAASIDSFWSSPIFGGDTAGGHSKILDIFGTMGILGGIPFLMIVWSSLKLNLSVVSDSYIKMFLYSSYVIAFIYLYQKGIFGATGWLFMVVIVPCCLYSLQNQFIKK